MSDIYNPLYQAARAVPKSEPQYEPEENDIPPVPELSPSLSQRAGEASVGFLAGAGNFLDIPGSMVRDVATWLPGGAKPANPFDQLLSPFSDKNRITGRELLREHKAVREKDNWGNFVGGIVLEAALDPLTYTGIGVMTKGGKVLDSLGEMKNIKSLADDMAKAKAAGKFNPPKGMGKRSAEGRLSVNQIIDFAGNGKQGEDALRLKNAAREKYKQKYIELYGSDKGMDEAFDKPLKSMVSFHLPTKDFFGEGTWQWGVKNPAGQMDDYAARGGELSAEQKALYTQRQEKAREQWGKTGADYGRMTAQTFRQMLDETAKNKSEADNIYAVHEARAAALGKSLDDFVGDKYAALEKHDTYVPKEGDSQTWHGGKKGLIRALDDDRLVVNVFADAQDVSTLLHETAHAFATDLGDDQMSIIKNWLKIDDAERIDPKFVMPRVQNTMGEMGKARNNYVHEMIARGMEYFFGTGKTPTDMNGNEIPGLRGVFDTYKTWIKNIYGSLKKLIGKGMSAEMKQFYNDLFVPEDGRAAKGGPGPTPGPTPGPSPSAGPDGPAPAPFTDDLARPADDVADSIEPDQPPPAYEDPVVVNVESAIDQPVVAEPQVAGVIEIPEADRNALINRSFDVAMPVNRLSAFEQEVLSAKSPEDMQRLSAELDGYSKSVTKQEPATSPSPASAAQDVEHTLGDGSKVSLSGSDPVVASGDFDFHRVGAGGIGMVTKKGEEIPAYKIAQHATTEIDKFEKELASKYGIKVSDIPLEASNKPTPITDAELSKLRSMYVGRDRIGKVVEPPANAIEAAAKSAPEPYAEDPPQPYTENPLDESADAVNKINIMVKRDEWLDPESLKKLGKGYTELAMKSADFDRAYDINGNLYIGHKGTELWDGMYPTREDAAAARKVDADAKQAAQQKVVDEQRANVRQAVAEVSDDSARQAEIEARAKIDGSQPVAPTSLAEANLSEAEIKQIQDGLAISARSKFSGFGDEQQFVDDYVQNGILKGLENYGSFDPSKGKIVPFFIQRGEDAHIDNVRKSTAQKRGGGATAQSVDDMPVASRETPPDLEVSAAEEIPVTATSQAQVAKVTPPEIAKKFEGMVDVNPDKIENDGFDSMFKHLAKTRKNVGGDRKNALKDDYNRIVGEPWISSDGDKSIHAMARDLFKHIYPEDRWPEIDEAYSNAKSRANSAKEAQSIRNSQPYKNKSGLDEYLESMGVSPDLMGDTRDAMLIAHRSMVDSALMHNETLRDAMTSGASDKSNAGMARMQHHFNTIGDKGLDYDSIEGFDYLVDYVQRHHPWFLRGDKASAENALAELVASGRVAIPKLHSKEVYESAKGFLGRNPEDGSYTRKPFSYVDDGSSGFADDSDLQYGEVGDASFDFGIGKSSFDFSAGKQLLLKRSDGNVVTRAVSEVVDVDGLKKVRLGDELFNTEELDDGTYLFRKGQRYKVEGEDTSAPGVADFDMGLEPSGTPVKKPAAKATNASDVPPGLAYSPSDLTGYNEAFAQYESINRDVTPKRLSAAERALKRERDKNPLIAEQIASEQPTPLERISEYDSRMDESFKGMHDHRQAAWREGLEEIAKLPEDQQREFLREWNNSPAPKQSEYFAGHAKRFASGDRATKYQTPDRSGISDSALRAQIEKTDRTIAKLREMNERATDKSITNQRLAEEQSKLEAMLNGGSEFSVIQNAIARIKDFIEADRAGFENHKLTGLKAYSAHNPGDPHVAFKFEHGTVYNTLMSAESAQTRAGKRGMGRLVGVEPITTEDALEIYSSPYQMERLSNTHPRAVKYNQRMELKSQLPKKLQPMVTYAKRLTKAKFLEKYSGDAMEVSESTGMTLGDFWRKVRGVDADTKAKTDPLIERMNQREKGLRDSARTEIRDQVIDLLKRSHPTDSRWYSVSLMADTLRQTSRAITGEAFHSLSKKDQTSVVKSVLEDLKKTGDADSAIGPGARGGEAREYSFMEKVSPGGNALLDVATEEASSAKKAATPIKNAIEEAVTAQPVVASPASAVPAVSKFVDDAVSEINKSSDALESESILDKLGTLRWEMGDDPTPQQRAKYKALQKRIDEHSKLESEMGKKIYKLYEKASQEDQIAIEQMLAKKGLLDGVDEEDVANPFTKISNNREARQGKKGPAALFQDDSLPGVKPDGLGFYSQAARSISAIMQGTDQIDVDKLVKLLKLDGVTQEEIDDIGLSGWRSKDRTEYFVDGRRVDGSEIHDARQAEHENPLLKQSKIKGPYQSRVITRSEIEKLLYDNIPYMKEESVHPGASWGSRGGTDGRMIYIQSSDSMRKRMDIHDKHKLLEAEAKKKYDDAYEARMAIMRDGKLYDEFEKYKKLSDDGEAFYEEASMHSNIARNAKWGQSGTMYTTRPEAALELLKKHGINGEAGSGSSVRYDLDIPAPYERMGSPFDDGLAVAHIEDVTLPNGKKMLRVNSVVSGWHGDATKSRGTAIHPAMAGNKASKNWLKLGLKRLIYKAVNDGYDVIGITERADAANIASKNYRDNVGARSTDRVVVGLREILDKYKAYDGIANDPKMEHTSYGLKTQEGDFHAFEITPEMKEDFIGNGVPLYQSTKDQLNETKTNIKELAKQNIGAVREFLKNLPQDKAMAAAEALDAGQAILDNTYPVRLAKALFNKDMYDATSREGQDIALKRAAAVDKSIDEFRRLSVPIFEFFDKVGLFDDEKLYAKVAALDKYKNAKPEDISLKVAEIMNDHDRRITEYLEGVQGEGGGLGGLTVANEGISALRNEDLSQLTESLDLMKMILGDEYIKDMGAGVVYGELMDMYADYFPAQMTFPTTLPFNPNIGPMLETTHAGMKRRRDTFRNIPGGRAVFKDISVDKVVSGLRYRQPSLKLKLDDPDFKAAREHIFKNYGKRLGVENRKNISELNGVTGWAVNLEKWYADTKYPAFSRNPLSVFMQRVQNGIRTRYMAESAYEIIGKTAKRIDRLEHVGRPTELKGSMNIGDMLLHELRLDNPIAAQHVVNRINAGEEYSKYAAKVTQEIQEHLATGKDYVIKRGNIPTGEVIRSEGERYFVVRKTKSTKDVPDPVNAEADGIERAPAGENDTPGVPMMEESRIEINKDQIAGYARVPQLFLNKFVVPEPVANDMLKIMQPFREPESVKHARALFEKMTNLYRAHLTGPFIPFHSRNLMGGQFMNLIFKAAIDRHEKNPIKKIWTPIQQAHQLYNFHADRIPGPNGSSSLVPQSKYVLKGIAKQVTFPPEVMAKYPNGMSDADATLELVREIFIKSVVGRSVGIAAEQSGNIAHSLENLSMQYPGGMAGRYPWKGTPSRKDLTALDAANPLHVKGGFGPEFYKEGDKTKLRMVQYDADGFLLARWGHDSAYWVEFMNRIPVYLSARKNGLNMDRAAEEVNKVHFDYDGLSQFERKYMRVIFPFWTFTSRMAGGMISELSHNPGGPMGQTIMAMRNPGDTDSNIPDHIKQSLSIDVGTSPDGTKSFITGFGLPIEDPMPLGQALMGDYPGTMRNVISRMNPLIKAPIEAAFQRSTFYDGPFGGKELTDLDPTLGRTVANLKQIATGEKTEGRADPLISNTFEFAVSNSPAARYTSYARTLTDPRKWENPLYAASNLLSGVKVAQVSPAAQDAVLRERMARVLKDFGGREISMPYIPENRLERLSESDKAEVAEVKKVINAAAKRSREVNKRRREEREKEAAAKLEEAVNKG